MEPIQDTAYLARLRELEREERAHDAAVAAVRRLRVRQVALLDRVQDGTATDFDRGWLAAAHDFAEAIVRG